MRKSLLVLATALTTVSCASTPAFQPETVLPEAPARFTSEPAMLGQTAAENWITAMGDPALTGLVEEAFGANPSLAQSLARFDAARASARVAGSDRLPSLSGSLGVERTEPGGTDSYSFGLSSSWEVDLWGRVRNTANAGTLDAEAAAEDLRGAQLSVAGQVAKSWYALIEARQQTELAERDLQTRRDTLALTERRFARGLVRSSDVRTARSSVASSEAAVASRRRSEASSARTLETLLGRYPAARIAHDGDFPALAAPGGLGSPQDLLTRRPDVLAAERRLLSAGLRADAARAALFPSLSLSGSTGGGGVSLEDALDVDDFISNMAASLTAPIFRGGQLRAQRDQAQANAELAVASYAQTVLSAWQEAENALYADTILTERVESLRQAFEEAAAAEELVIRQYARGVSTIFALLDANSRRISAESQYISAQRERVTNRIDLYLAIAGDFAVAGSSEPAMRAGE